MANPARLDAAAWALDIFHPTAGTLRHSSMDLTTPAAVATLGAPYRGSIKNGREMVVVHELPDGTGVDIASSLTVRLGNKQHPVTGAWRFDRSLEWRDVPVRLRYYDLTNDVATEDFTGVINVPDFPPGDMVIRISSHGEAELATMIPIGNAAVDTARFPKAGDAGSSLPVFFGEGLAQPPLVGRDDQGSDSAAGGDDYGVSAQPGTQVIAAYWDTDQNAPGLERADQWITAPGSPTRTGNTTFTVTGSLKDFYTVGMPIRWKNSGDPIFHYSHIVSYSSGTVTIGERDANLTGTISEVGLVGDYIVEQNRYFLTPPSTNAITTMRSMLGLKYGAPIVRGRYNGFSNPATAIKEVLTNAVWSIGGAVNSGTFTTAASAATTLGIACNGTLAGDRQPRQCGIIVNEMLRLCRGILTKNTSGQWEIDIDDAAPAAPTVTLGFGDGVYNNIKAIESDTRTPLAQCVASLRVMYLRGARSRTNTRLIPIDYGKSVTKTVLSIGREATITSPWARDYDTAALQAHYEGEILKARDRKITLRAGLDARNLRLRQNVNLIGAPIGLSSPTAFTVCRIEKRLGEVRLRCEGYSANIYTAPSGVTTEQDDADVGDERTVPGTGINLVVNADFSTRLKREGAPATPIDSQILPGWEVICSPPNTSVTALSYTADPLAAGGGYITFTVAGSDANLLASPTGLQVAITDACRPIGEKRVYVKSYYGDSVTGLRCFVEWFDDQSGGVRVDDCPQTWTVKDINGKGWVRRYSIFRAPPNSMVLGSGVRVAYARPAIVATTAGTYRIDAAQFELATRNQHGPSSFKRHTPVGWDPGRGQPGALTILSSDSRGEEGVELKPLSYDVVLTNGASSIEVDGSGAKILKANATVWGVVAYISTGITFNGGGTKIRIGPPADADAWGAIPDTITTALTAGNKTGHANWTVGLFGFTPSVDTELLLTPDAGTFAGGALTISLTLLKQVPRQA